MTRGRAAAREGMRLVSDLNRMRDALTGSPGGSGDSVDINTATWGDIVATTNSYELAGILWRIRDRFDETGMSRAAFDAWTATAEPGECLSRQQWGALFKSADFAVNGVPSIRPPGWIEMFRGASMRSARGLSWTPDREWAEYHATRRERGIVVRIIVPWRAVLAEIELDERTPEHELIIDPDVIATHAIEEIRGSNR